MPDPQAAPTNREAGEQLHLTLPRVDGDSVALGDLQGHVVVLEVSATWTENWRDSFTRYNALVREHPDQVTAVLLLVDPRRDVLSPEPVVREPGFILGWDPQGAVAAQLQLATFPTVLVLDRDGKIAHISAGARPTAQQLRGWVTPLLAAQ